MNILWLIISITASLCSFSGEAAIRHERVIWLERPATEASISWTSDQLDPSSKVYFDTQSRKGENDLAAYQFTALISKQGKFSRGIFHRGPFYNHAMLVGLEAETKYYFRIQSDGEVSAEYWFQTAPSKNKPFRLFFGGDSRSDHEQRLKMNALLKASFQQFPDILALVHGGDYIHNGSSWPQWDDWLSHHETTNTDDKRILPIVPTRGNHEISVALFNEVWNWPGNSKNYFTSLIGDLAILILNTEVSVNGDQRLWLERELELLRPSSPWLVANYHRPLYPAVKRPSSAKEAWVPLFEKYGVDMAFESDGHVYKQTAPIYQDTINEEKGIIYVGEGGLGVKQREPDLSKWYLQGSGMASSAHHFQILSVTSEKLVYTGIDEEFSVLSQFELSPRKYTDSLRN